MSRLFAMGAASVLMLAAIAPACSGGAHDGAVAQPTQQPAQPSGGREAALADLEKRQEAVCERVGKTLFECAVADARVSMSPEEFAKLEPERLEPEYMSRFLDECLENDMSTRQVSVFEGCLQDTRCEAFVPCLDGARPQQPAAR